MNVTVMNKFPKTEEIGWLVNKYKQNKKNWNLNQP